MSIDKIKTGDDLTQSLDIVSGNISKYSTILINIFNVNHYHNMILSESKIINEILHSGLELGSLGYTTMGIAYKII